MLKKIIPKSDFSRNVLTLLTGTALAQAIPIAISPILTRIYSPENFGVFALYLSIASIISIIATGRYELAIMLPTNEEDAANIVVLSIIVAVLVSSAILVVVVLFNEQIINLIDTPNIANWIYFIPVTVLLTGVCQSLSYWSNRKRQYKRLSASRVVQSTGAAGVNVGMGFNGYGVSGLILGGVIGQISSVAILIKAVWDEDLSLFKKVNRLKVYSLATQYIDFLKFSTPSALFNSFSNIGFPLIISLFFNSTVVGMYFFSNKMIRAPLSFIFSSLSQVYFQTASKLYVDDKQKLLKFTYQTQLKIISILIPMLLTISIIAPYMFEIVFGDNWRIAGEYVKFFAVFVFFNSLYSPISSLGDILNQQKFTLFFNVSLSLSQVIIMYVGSCFFDFRVTILVVSVVGSMHFIYIDHYMKKKLKLKLKS